MESSSDTESESTRSSTSSSDDDKDGPHVPSRKISNLKRAEKNLSTNLGMSSFSLQDDLYYLIMVNVIYFLLAYTICTYICCVYAHVQDSKGFK